MKKNFDLSWSSIRINSRNDLFDTNKLAKDLLSAQNKLVDKVTLDLYRDLLIAVLMVLAYGPDPDSKTIDDVLSYLSDPRWDTKAQILLSLANDATVCKQLVAAKRFKKFSEKLLLACSSPLGVEAMVTSCHRHWRMAFEAGGYLAGATLQIEPPPNCLQVFDLHVISKALVLAGEMRDEKKSMADRLLQNAKLNGGFRLVPDARQAHAKLESAKTLFENLVEPIARLQTDLTLAASMDPRDFYISPILLLGDPGIGKTFLASQLADALGVASETISAGGAQGNFQLTGSHSSWTHARAGSLFALLAEGKSAAPVMVVDEVDKISSSTQFPILPVLLDLLEPRTARVFKDQFFDMEFDASRVIVILTANSLDTVPAPLLSRVEVFEVPRPEPAQRLRIIHSLFDDLLNKTDAKIELDQDSSHLLAERVDIDLRRLTRLVRAAFSNAMQYFDYPVAKMLVPPMQGNRKIGFY